LGWLDAHATSGLLLLLLLLLFLLQLVFLPIKRAKWGTEIKASRNLQSNVIRVQQALNSSKFSCFLCFTLGRYSETTFVSKKPLTMVVDGRYVREDARARDIDTVWQRAFSSHL
jgi:hypothetical protein